MDNYHPLSPTVTADCYLISQITDNYRPHYMPESPTNPDFLIDNLTNSKTI